MPNPEIKRAADMDIIGQLFGVRFVHRDGLRDLVELYIEDDEAYHLKASFDALWLNDLRHISTDAWKRFNQADEVAS
jgi:hypothetical protein